MNSSVFQAPLVTGTSRARIRARLLLDQGFDVIGAAYSPRLACSRTNSSSGCRGGWRRACSPGLHVGTVAEAPPHVLVEQRTPSVMLSMMVCSISRVLSMSRCAAAARPLRYRVGVRVAGLGDIAVTPTMRRARPSASRTTCRSGAPSATFLPPAEAEFDVEPRDFTLVERGDHTDVMRPVVVGARRWRTRSPAHIRAGPKLDRAGAR